MERKERHTHIIYIYSTIINTSFSLMIAYIPSPENLFAWALLRILVLSMLELLTTEALSPEIRALFWRCATQTNHYLFRREDQEPIKHLKKWERLRITVCIIYSYIVFNIHNNQDIMNSDSNRDIYHHVVYVARQRPLNNWEIEIHLQNLHVLITWDICGIK